MLHEVSLVPILMYDRETVVWREERFRIMAIQMDISRFVGF